MSLTDYKKALEDLRDLIKRGDLVGARRQLLVARTFFAAVPDGSFDGAAYQLRADELTRIEQQLDREVERQRSTSNERAIHTRTSFPTRGLGW